MSASGQNMNCETYREAIAADPSATFEGADHAGTCEACAAFTAEMQALDAKIAKALAFDTPDLAMPDLPPIEDDNVVSLPVRSRNRAPSWIAIAASFAIAAIIGVQFIEEPSQFDSLSDEILAHLEHEPEAFVVTDVPVPEARLSDVMHSGVGTLDRNVGLITYAQTCPINGKIPHLVIQGEKGPVTLLLMPDEKIDTAELIEGDNVNGVILPVGDGSIAIIGERDEDLALIDDRVIDSVEWSI